MQAQTFTEADAKQRGGLEKSGGMVEYFGSCGILVWLTFELSTPGRAGGGY